MLWVYVRVYLCNLCGAPHQIVDVIIELQLPLGGHFFDVGASEHHFVRKTGDRKRAVTYCIYYAQESDATLSQNTEVLFPWQPPLQAMLSEQTLCLV